MEPGSLLEFEYVNHRGEDHVYLVHPKRLEFKACRCFPDEPEREAWCVVADVLQRDREDRPGERSFALMKLVNVKEV